MNKQFANTWIKIADSIEGLSFSKEGFANVQAADKNVCIALHKGRLTACAARCPHAGGTLSEGHIDVLGNIVCPLHHYKFNLESGRNVTGEGYNLKTYPIETRPDGIFIELEISET